MPAHSARGAPRELRETGKQSGRFASGLRLYLLRQRSANGIAQRCVILINQSVNGTCGHIEDRHRIHTKEDGEDHERIENELLTRAQIKKNLEALLGQRTKHHLAVEPKRITG